MTRSMQFERDPDNNRWYAVIPEWTGDRAELEMVLGADEMLDIISKGNYEVELNMSTELTQSDQLTLIAECEGESSGAYYHLATWKGKEYDMQMWLCDVCRFVFGEFPKTIYLQ